MTEKWSKVEINWNSPLSSLHSGEVETGCEKFHVTCHLVFLLAPSMFGGYSAALHDIIKTILQRDSSGPVLKRPLPPCVVPYLLCSGKAVLMSGLSEPHIRIWSQWRLKEWDHFSIDCGVGQCKGHLLWQSGRCCLSACLSRYRPACLPAFILTCLLAFAHAQLSVYRHLYYMHSKHTMNVN